jgi:hypothetical protein
MTKILQGFQKLSKDPQLLAIVFFAFFSNGMMSTMIGSILPLMTAEYQLSYTVGGMAISAHQAGNLLACFVSGFLPYAIGRKKSTIFSGRGHSDWNGFDDAHREPGGTPDCFCGKRCRTRNDEQHCECGCIGDYDR